jgi:tetratricopeptide (TPR) repeat protein
MMKRFLFLICIVPLLFLHAGAFAQLETGGVDNIFSYGAGLRALGMGGAFIAMKNDPTLAYWNPGAMSFNQHKEVSFFGTRTIASSYYFSGFYTNPTVSFGTLSIGALGLYTNGIQSYDENASPITGARTDYLHYQLLISYGYNFKWGFGVGASAKVEQMRITEYKGTGASFDVGVYYNPAKIPWLSVGAVVQDVYSTGIKLLDEFEQSTRVYKAGLATNFYSGEQKNTRISFALDGRFYNDNYNSGQKQFLYDLSFGTEVSFAESLSFRAGYHNFTLDSLGQGLPQGLSLGVGIRRWGVGIDYAVNFEDTDWQGPLDLLMRLGISYRFGLSMEEKKAKIAEDIRRQIDEGIRKVTETYEDKLEELTVEYNQEKDRIIRQLDEKYEEKVSELDESLEESRQEINNLTTQLEEEKQALMEDLEQQYASQRAAIESQFAEERSTYEGQISRLQERFEEETSLSEKLLADEAFKSQKYALGLQLYSDGEYDEALTEFETVARFDPDYLSVQEYINRTKAELRDVKTYSPEILAIYYRGIDLFVQKNYEGAITEWEKILEIDPYNKLARRNIKEARDRLRKLRELGINQ